MTPTPHQDLPAAADHAALRAAATSDWLDADGRPIDEEDRGLLYDLTTLDRRRVLGLFGGAGAMAVLAACGGGAGTTSSGSAASTTTQSSAAGAPGAGPGGAPGGPPPGGGGGPAQPAGDGVDNSGVLPETPDETNGPYPADGSNGVDVLTRSGIVRSDIRSSFGAATTTAAGIPLSFTLSIRDAKTGNARAGAAVYVWHCDAAGRYSLYSQGATGENYLRGVQEADASGNVTFTSVFPACYTGRWPHIHFEVYSTVADATSSGAIVKTSQLALPKEACDAVYATTGYEQSVGNLSQLTLASDSVFGNDGGIHQIATMAGSPSAGFTAALTVGV